MKYILPMLCCFSVILSAQPSVEWGPTMKEPSNSYFEEIVTIQPDRVVTLRGKVSNQLSERPKIWLESITKNSLRLRTSTEIDLRYKGKDRRFEEVITMRGGAMFLLSSFNNAGKKQNYLFSQTISQRRLEPRDKMDMILQIPAGYTKPGDFFTRISRDSSRLLVIGNPDLDDDAPETVEMGVFDENLQTIWTKTVRLPYNEEKFVIEDYRVDPQGNAYLLGVLFTDGTRRRRRGEPNYRYVLFSFPAGGDTMEETNLDLPEVFTTDMTFRVANDGNIVCSGFYGQQGSYSVRGTYFLKLDPRTGDILTQQLSEFDLNFRGQFLSKRENKRAVKQAERGEEPQIEIDDIALDRLILRSDGGAVLIAEQYFIERENFYNDPYYGAYGGFYNRRFRTVQQNYTVYNYNDIFVLNIRPDGTLDWASNISKVQQTVDDGGYFSSYAMAVAGDKLYFVFNDNAANYRSDIDRLRVYDGRSDGVVALATVSRDGSVDVEPLRSKEAVRVAVRPKVCRQIGRQELLLFSERGRSVRFGVLGF